MKIPEYILFIDTETSGIPKHWSASAKRVDKWPYILQIAWAIYTRSGEKVVFRNFYNIDAGDVDIDHDAQLIHGITNQMLDDKGIKRKKALNLLAKDLKKYEPLMVGHFLELDKRMVEVGFVRAGIEHDLSDYPKFCTMRFSRNLSTHSTSSHFMRLNELYKYIFGSEMQWQHNAFYDVMATKECFFELVNQGAITEKTVREQQSYFRKTPLYLKILLATIVVVILFAAIIWAWDK